MLGLVEWVRDADFILLKVWFHSVEQPASSTIFIATYFVNNHVFYFFTFHPDWLPRYVTTKPVCNH